MLKKLTGFFAQIVIGDLSGLPLNHLMENEGESPEDDQPDDPGDVALNVNLYDHMIKAFNKIPVKKYTCYSCDPPDCRELPPCTNALQVSFKYPLR